MATKKISKTFSEEERAAMRERALELAAEERVNRNRTEGEKVALAAISAMSEPDRGLAKRIHEIVKKTAPELLPKTWYGMPAYTNREGKVVCFFQSGHKYKSRYCTFGFQDAANLDEGNMWPTSFAIKKLTPTEEAKIAALVKRAAI